MLNRLIIIVAFILLASIPILAQLPNPTKFNQTFKHHTATVNDVRLHYVTGGKGEPIVLLHGFGGTWYTWRHTMPALAERYTVIVPDMRGAGDSAKPVSGYDTKTAAEDIYQLVQKLGHKRIYLVGHDIGVMVAYAYAAAHPEDVRRLVLLDSAPPGAGDWENYIRDPNRWHLGFHQVLNLPEALVEGRERIYLNRFWQDLAYDPTAITEADKDEYLRSYAAPGGMRAAFAYYRALPQDVKDNQEYLKRKLQMPVLAIGGAQGSGKSAVDIIKTIGTNVRGEVIENCGHWISEERPEYLNQLLLTFFNAEK